MNALHRGEVRQAVVALDVAEDDVEQRERRPGREEVLHVGVPRPVEARDERQPGVVVEQHEPRLVDRRDRHAVVPGRYPGCPGDLHAARNDSPSTGLDAEEQAELARRTDITPGRVRPPSVLPSTPPLPATRSSLLVSLSPRPRSDVTRSGWLPPSAMAIERRGVGSNPDSPSATPTVDEPLRSDYLRQVVIEQIAGSVAGEAPSHYPTKGRCSCAT